MTVDEITNHINRVMSFSDKLSNDDFFDEIENIIWERINIDQRLKTNHGINIADNISDKNELSKAIGTLRKIANRYADK